MDRREFVAAAGTVAAVVSVAQAFGANDQLPYPDIGAIKKIPSEGEAGAAMEVSKVERKLRRRASLKS